MVEERLCPKCSAANPAGTSFCSKCGTALPNSQKTENVDPLVGAFVGERFLVQRKIGEGGMGVVYEAEQTAMDRKVALKVLHPHLTDEDLYARFRNEAAASSKLEHPNIITVYDFGRTETDSLYIAMEFISGKSLDDEIKESGALNWQRSCRIGSQICSALRNAHEKSIIHRDMKPENIMLCKRGDDSDFVKVLDFGIAKLMDEGTDQRKALTKTGMVFGTPQYMSPEQVRGEKLDSRSDIYSVGIILYEMLTGRLPFTADTPMGLLTRHLMDTPPPFGEVNSNNNVPPELEQLVMQSLSKDAGERPQTMKEFGQALDGAIGIEHSGKTTALASAVAAPSNGSQDIAASKTMPMPAKSAPTPVVQKSGSSPVVGIIVGVVVLLLAGTGAGWYFLLGPGSSQNTAPNPSSAAAQPVNTSTSDVKDTEFAPEPDADNLPPGPESLSADPSANVDAGASASKGKSSGKARPNAAQLKQLAQSGKINPNNVTDEQKKKIANAAGNLSDEQKEEIINKVDPEKLPPSVKPIVEKVLKGNCVVNSQGGKTASIIARSLRRKSGAIKACIRDGSDSSSFSFSVQDGEKKLSNVSKKKGNASQGNCVANILRGLRLVGKSQDDKNGTLNLKTQKENGELTKCQGLVRL